MNLKPIAFVKSPVAEAVDENWGEVISEIHLNELFAPGLRGIGEFSHLLVVYYMHQATFNPASDLIRRPQGREDMPLVGIFAQRAKHRPNPIGITAAKFISLEGNILRVKGLDAIDGTPVLDIKPYFPVYDRKDDAKVPQWVDSLMENYF